jgi:hypothetical protein
LHDRRGLYRKSSLLAITIHHNARGLIRASRGQRTDEFRLARHGLAVDRQDSVALAEARLREDALIGHGPYHQAVHSRPAVERHPETAAWHPPICRVRIAQIPFGVALNTTNGSRVACGLARLLPDIAVQLIGCPLRGVILLAHTLYAARRGL